MSKIVQSDTQKPSRAPVHVVYGGADRFSADTPQKLGKIAVAAMVTYAPNFVEFADSLRLPASESLPRFPEAIAKLKKQIARNHTKARSDDFGSWLAWTIYRKTLEKLEREPVEDLRIDFEDGYGFRTDDEEDRDAERSANELGTAFLKSKITPFCGFRIKSLASETHGRAIRTLDLFLDTLLQKTNGQLPENFVVTLPKITDKKQVKELCDRLKSFEKKAGLKTGSIGIEIMIETPLSIIDRKGNFALKELVETAKGRCTSAHFGAFDYTSALGISSTHQHLRHDACNFARQMMLLNLAPLGIRLVDSVTTLLPVAIHKTGRLTNAQISENRRSVHEGWREHFSNVTESMKNGFYQSWDLHPNQLVPRYAAVYSFFVESADGQASRLKEFLAKATQATLTGNTFDDAASAEGILNFFRSGFDCGAFNDKEIRDSTGLTAGELSSGTFQQIAEQRMAEANPTPDPT